MTSESPPAYLAALRILQYRWNSVAELRRKLRAKEFAADDIDAAIERLASEGWIDDERFAGAFVRTRALKRVGAKRIARELGAAGVSEETARRALSENADPEREREGAAALCAKKIRILARRHGAAFPATDEGRNKLTIWLLNQGYDAALVRETVRNALRVTTDDPQGDQPC